MLNEAHRGILRMATSLQIAVTQAHGPWFDYERMKRMTVEELILELGPNNIVFKYLGENPHGENHRSPVLTVINSQS